jgi:SAM-dependent methyltransferase
MTPEARRASYHDVHLQEHPARPVVWRAIAAHLDAYVPRAGSVVEIGAGHCHWINAVQTTERRVAVDVWGDLPRYVAPGVEPHVMDVRRSLRTLGERQFDVALASNVLEHFEPDEAADVAAQVFDILRPGGRFIVIQPNFRHAWRSYFDDFTHRSIFTDVSLANMLRSQQFTIDEVRPKFLPYSMRNVSWTVPSWVVRAYLRSPFKPGAGQMLVVARRH